MENVTQAAHESQEAAFFPAGESNVELRLSRCDRRLLLISSLSLFLRRARHGYPVTSADLVHLADYGDPTESPAVPSVITGVAA